MTPGKIWKLMLQKKAFQIWEIAEELQKLYPFIPKKWIRDKVREFVKTQINNNALMQVSLDPPVFAIKKFAGEWKKYARFNTCPICGSSFLPQNPQEIYCSKKCAGKEYARRKWRKVKPPKRLNKHWSEEELEMLKEEIRKKGKLSAKDIRELSDKLGRSFKSVLHKYYEVREDALHLQTT